MHVNNEIKLELLTKCNYVWLVRFILDTGLDKKMQHTIKIEIIIGSLINKINT